MNDGHDNTVNGSPSIVGGGVSSGGESRDGSSKRQRTHSENSIDTNNEQQRTDNSRPTLSPLFKELHYERGEYKYRDQDDLSTFLTSRKLSDEERKEAQEKRIHRALGVLSRSKGYYVSDVFNCSSSEQANEVSNHLQRNSGSFIRGFLIISLHGNHVHVAHDCSYSNGSCRCKFIEKTENGTGIRRRRRSIRRRPVSASLSETDVRNILQYFSERSEGRQIENINIGGRVERQQIETCILEDRRSDGCETGGRVEKCEENDDTELRLCDAGRAYHYGSYSLNRKEGEKTSKTKRRKTDRVQEKTEAILTKLKLNPMSPIQGLLQHRCWNEDMEFRFIKEDDPQFKMALSNWLSTLVNYSTEDFINMYSHEECNLIFAAGVTDPSVYYYNLDDSYKYVMELLNFQFNNDSESVSNFIVNLFDIVERVKPKLNTMLVISPTSAGKNWFFDMVCNFYLNVGHLGNPNRYNAFAFQDAHSRRIIMWNEINYAPEHIEAMKELLGGDSTNVSVKYKSEIPIYRTPIFILTNRPNLSIINDPTFKDRISVYRWQSAPMLKPLTRKPHPLTVIKLYNNFYKKQ